MSEPANDEARRNPGTGLLGHVSGLLAANLAYLRARLELAGLEGRDAGLHVALLAGLLAGGLVAVIFGYVLLVIALVFLVGLAFGGGNAWIWVLLAAAVLHFLGAAVLVLIARGRLAVPLFPITLAELKKDQEWLKTNAKPN